MLYAKVTVHETTHSSAGGLLSVTHIIMKYVRVILVLLSRFVE